MEFSIIILSYLRYECLIKCLNSLYVNSCFDHEVIVIEQSNDESFIVKLKELFPKLHIEISKENLGCAKGRNFGTRFASKEYILFLDDDCYVDKDWDRNIPNLISQYGPDVFTVQLKETYRSKYTPYQEPDSTVIKAGFIDFTTKLQCVNFNPNKEAIVCTALRGVAFHRKEVLQKVGGFDEQYFMGTEDYDYALKVRDYKIMYFDNVYINHFHEGSDLYEKQRWDLNVINNGFLYFEKKWALFLRAGVGNLLLNLSSPKELVLKRLHQLRRRHIEYKYFSDSQKLINEVKQIHKL